MTFQEEINLFVVHQTLANERFLSMKDRLTTIFENDLREQHKYYQMNRANKKKFEKVTLPNQLKIFADKCDRYMSITNSLVRMFDDKNPSQIEGMIEKFYEYIDSKAYLESV